MHRAAIALPILVLLGCDDSGVRGQVRLTVNNYGLSSVFVQVRVERGDDSEGNSQADTLQEYVLDANRSTSDQFGDVIRLKMRVTRLRDNVILFDDFWDAEDLRKAHDDVVVTLQP